MQERFNDRHVEDLLDAYALGALEPDEVDIVERHLEGCASCTTQMEAARLVAAQLVYAAPFRASAVPPASLRDRVMARIAAEAATSGPSTDLTATGEVPALRTFRQPAPTNPFARLAQSIFGAGRDRSAEVDRLLSDLLTDPSCTIWSLPGTESMPGATARLVGLPSRQDAVLVTRGLQRQQLGQEYQVWFLRGGQPMPNALFRVDSSGRATSILRAPKPLRDFDLVAITPEPVGGSPGPTGPIVVAGSLQEGGSSPNQSGQ